MRRKRKTRTLCESLTCCLLIVWETNPFRFQKVSLFHNFHRSSLDFGIDEQRTNKAFLFFNRYCVMKLTERLKKEGIDINLRDALGVDTDPKLRNLRGKL